MRVLNLLSVGVFLLASIQVSGQTFTSGTNVTIPDAGAETCSNMAVTGVGTIDGSYGLESVCIQIDHTWDSDLDIFLVAPDGTRVELSTDNGGSGDDYGTNCSAANMTCFDMAAGTNITSGTASFVGSYVPEGDLGDVNNGQNANGTWQLCVTDDASGDNGRIDCWALTFSANPAPPGGGGGGEHTIGTGNLTQCTGDVYDSGGSGGSYSNSETLSETYCSDAGDCLSLTFNSFSTESCCDDLTIYDGTSTADPIIGTYAGTSLNGVTIESSSGCLHLVWDSDGSVTGAGWDATISCAACPTCSDGIQNGSETGVDCGGSCPNPCPCDDIAIGSLPYSSTGNNTSGYGDDYSSSDACGSSYMNGDDVVYSYTPSSNECVNIVLTNTGTYTGVFLLDGCPDDVGTSCVASNTQSGGNPAITNENLTAGTTYYIVISTFPSPQSTAYDLDISICATEHNIGEGDLTQCTDDVYDTGGSAGNYGNSETLSETYCSDAGDCLSLTFNSFSTESCCDDLSIYDGTSTADPLIGTYAGTTLNGVTIESSSGCLHLVWDSDGSVTDGGWDATISCGTCPTCSDGIQNGSETGVDCGGTCTACPCADVTIGSLPYSSTGNNTSTYGDDFDSGDGCTSSYMGGDDVVYEFTPAVDTCVEITLTNTGTYVGLFVMDGCPDAPGTSCIDSDTQSSGNPSLSGISLTGGTTYYFVISTWPAPQTTTYDISVTGVVCPVTSACGNLANNDFCSDPATLTQGSGSWSSTTSSTFSADSPGNVGSLFCGSIENNSWYQFTAVSTSETFTFGSIGGTSCSGSGIQAEVYDVTTDANGCCTSFSSMSNCYNPATTTGGTVTATGLTVGLTYYLMVDGYGGDACDFTVSNWTATGILPVELVRFDGFQEDGLNHLHWVTASELENDYFELQRSDNGVNYSTIVRIDGAGTTNEQRNYSHLDTPNKSVHYYRLRQVDYDGKEQYSNPVIISGNFHGVELVNTYPNPSKDLFNLELYSTSRTAVTLFIYDMVGMLVGTERLILSKGSNLVSTDQSNLAAGNYSMRIVDENGQVVAWQKLSRN